MAGDVTKSAMYAGAAVGYEEVVQSIVEDRSRQGTQTSTDDFRDPAERRRA